MGRIVVRRNLDDDYKVGQTIGSGAYSVVKEAVMWNLENAILLISKSSAQRRLAQHGLRHDLVANL